MVFFDTQCKKPLAKWSVFVERWAFKNQVTSALWRTLDSCYWLDLYLICQTESSIYLENWFIQTKSISDIKIFLTDCPIPEFVGDGACDNNLNIFECDFDGGDCSSECTFQNWVGDGVSIKISQIMAQYFYKQSRSRFRLKTFELETGSFLTGWSC